MNQLKYLVAVLGMAAVVASAQPPGPPGGPPHGPPHGGPGFGGPPDIAYNNGMDDFRRIANVPVAVANLPVGHGGTYQEPNGGAAAQVAVSWLEWQLRGDATAARRFVGDDCGLCRDSSWTLERRNFPAVAGRH